MKLYKSAANSWIAGEMDFILTPGEVLCEFIEDYVKLTDRGGSKKIVYNGPITEIQKHVDGSFVNIADRADFEVSFADFFVKAPSGGGQELGGTRYVYVYGKGTPEDNAAELQAAYDKAKTMPRHLGTVAEFDFVVFTKGRSLSIGGIHIKSIKDFEGVLNDIDQSYYVEISEQEANSNRATVVVAPGEYRFGDTAFIADATCVDIVALTGNVDVYLSSAEIDPADQYGIGIVIMANNVHLKGINCGDLSFRIYYYLDKLECENCIGGMYSFGGTNDASGTFTNCIGGYASFGCYSTASGTFNNCTGGDYSFGCYGTASGTFNYCRGGNGSFGGYGTASGTFTNCTGGGGSFGGYAGTASGTFTNCTSSNYSFGGDGGTASGTFNNCTGDYGSFGGGSGTASGTFNSCTGGDYSFGSGNTASGTFNYCTGGDYSFGGNGIASGTFTNCTGGVGSFGSGNTASGTFNYCTGGVGSFGGSYGSIGATARLYYTRLTSGIFPTPQVGGRLVLCIDGTNSIINV